ncbi:MAG TPA: hypothetical protein VK504_10765, partial [Vicinamibacterales bacterium]|nr:hypothetical protein [Vicinamibacterales bacterium]
MLSYHPRFRHIPSGIPVSNEQILVATSPRAYPIDIGAGCLAQLGALLEGSGFPRRRIVVSSPTVWKLHGETAAASLGGAAVILIPDGERHKHLRTVSKVYDELVVLGADRGAGIIAVGGGVLGDTAGFAAATFLRGLPLVQ